MAEDRKLLLNLCASMGLADHLGDVADDVWHTLKLAGIAIPNDVDDLSELMIWLANEHGATSVFGTALTNDDEDDTP